MVAGLTFGSPKGPSYRSLAECDSSGAPGTRKGTAMRRRSSSGTFVILAIVAGLSVAGMLSPVRAAPQLSPNMQDMLRRIHTTQEFAGGVRAVVALISYRPEASG